ncbi:C4-dicarboxylate ABC transporter permease [Enterovibrio norvegicus FF-33]|uniref:TRAP transporter small permease protein n=1 Tax=Enterovibrio norvegicus FF-454 TaxID=1185651 RepID=A0A1E5CE65_9GAMM|nr:TRAP transporter small permease [Enterovibrio norvegicus]OEE63791.1 C4-dicarboxylate ABC transporter permease [Enterovibrio norvegicus FF-454]OEE66061.1 C4-dicarboxylate ABC transporter permease [Enterovibrio norvegicus FF-33]OEE88524.1 C4-dicarboxylate ABC transporter permease [Enterovibrio norvegicus FF-162]
MKTILLWFQRIADGVAVIMLAAMFLIFCAQIFSRYVLNAPIGWSSELLLTLWLWVIFWTGAFCLRNKDHIRFDLLFLSVPGKVQRIFLILSALGIIIGFGISFLPTWDYITFYKIKKSAILKWRLDYVFSIYGVFLGVIILRYGIALIQYLNPNYKVQDDDKDEQVEE